MNWYMQSREVTIEISDTKLLPPAQLPAHWEYNKRSFLNYIESIFYGVRGIVTDTAGNPLNAIITVLSHDTLHSEIRTDSLNGNYHRMLAPGVYSFQFSADGYYSQTINNVVVNNFQTTVLNVELGPNFIPVELTSFTAEVNENSVLLKWQTATENNSKGFEIERTSPHPSPYQGEGGEAGRGWETIGFVQGNGNSNSPKNYFFIDDNISGGKAVYRLKQIDTDGKFEYSKVIEIDVGSPAKFELGQNYPNPFNPVTTIKYLLPQSGNVKLVVYNLIGEQVVKLADEFEGAGVHTINFNASGLNSGVYIYKLEATGLVQSKKMILLK
jgi:hypothetical protein